MKRTAVIVGGGIAGLYSSILLKRRFDRVVLIERAPVLGGLLNSYTNEHGDSFDYGTHFIAGTEREEIDRDILPDEWTSQWQKFPNEVAANFFGGSLDHECIHLDARKISAQDYDKGIKEFLDIKQVRENPSNLAESLAWTYGETFKEKLFGPVLKSLFGVNSLKDLIPYANLRFAIKRFIAFTPEETRELKKQNCYDDRLAFHKYYEGKGVRPQYYPKAGGAGNWVKCFEKKLKEMGVEIRTSCHITKIEHQNKQVKSVQFEDGESLDCDLLVWTTPAFALLMAAGIEFKSSRPLLRETSLFHFTFDKAPLTDAHFFFCYDPAYTPFRVTLYSNLQPEVAEKTRRHRITCEVLSSGPLEVDEGIERLKKELVEMQVVSPEAKCLYAEMSAVKQGFPVLSHEFQKNKNQQTNLVEEKLENVLLVGKGGSNAWFMSEVYAEIYDLVEKKLKV